MRVLKYYLAAEKHIMREYNPDGTTDVPYTQYYGLGVEMGMVDLCNKYFADGEVWRGLRVIDKSARKIVEMHDLIYNLLVLLRDKTGLNTEEYAAMLERYKKISDTARKCHMLAMKYILSEKKDILYRLRDLYNTMFVDEHKTLTELYDYVYEKILLMQSF